MSVFKGTPATLNRAGCDRDGTAEILDKFDIQGVVS